MPLPKEVLIGYPLLSSRHATTICSTPPPHGQIPFQNYTLQLQEGTCAPGTHFQHPRLKWGQANNTLSEAIEELNLEFLLNELEKWTPGQVEVVETRRRVWKEEGIHHEL